MHHAPTFAGVYDLIYDDPALLDAQLRFLEQHLGQRDLGVLDVGCGTGLHLQALLDLGYRATGLDPDSDMLEVAQARLHAHKYGPNLVRGVAQTLPFTSRFHAVICLESPLAYLLDDRQLHAALQEFARVLHSGGLLVMDVFDYLGTIGEGGSASQVRRFSAPWGKIIVRETHTYDRSNALWRMTQHITLQQDATRQRLVARHVFRIRSPDTYAEAVERAGFQIIALHPAYPGTPPELRDEQRMIFVARKARVQRAIS